MTAGRGTLADYCARVIPLNRATFPIQATAHSHPSKRAEVNASVYMAAYEVYSHIYAPQDAMIQNGCRGGFGTGELIAFLYARGFPRQEWATRADEALAKMDIR